MVLGRLAQKRQDRLGAARRARLRAARSPVLQPHPARDAPLVQGRQRHPDPPARAGRPLPGEGSDDAPMDPRREGADLPPHRRREAPGLRFPRRHRADDRLWQNRHQCQRHRLAPRPAAGGREGQDPQAEARKRTRARGCRRRRIGSSYAGRRSRGSIRSSKRTRRRSCRRWWTWCSIPSRTRSSGATWG